MVEAMQKMCLWHTRAFMSLPVGDGYETEVTEFDYREDGGVCYDKNGVTVRHWRRSHTIDGASAYRLDWSGLSFVWTGDGNSDELTAKYAKPKARTSSSAKWSSTTPRQKNQQLAIIESARRPPRRTGLAKR